MSKGYFITGTDTGIGKTRTALALMAALQQSGKTVCGMKPVSAGCDVTKSGLRNEDAVKLMEQSSVALPYDIVNPYAWQPAIAPHIAAMENGREMTLVPIHECYQHIASQCDVVVVEGAGGWLVPLNGAQTMAAIAVELKLDVILVVGIRLGCLNHALLTVENILQRDCRLAGWVANVLSDTTGVTELNIDCLKEKINAPLLGRFPLLKEVTPVQLASELTTVLLEN